MGEVFQVAYGDRLRRLAACGLGAVMSNCNPVPPASWQPRHWTEVTNWLAAVTGPAFTQTLS